MPHESGLYYLESRYYNPEIGRFINADSLVSTGQGVLGYNMFAYCNNNPVIRIDENGEFGVTLGVLLAGALIGVVMQYICDVAGNILTCVSEGEYSAEAIFTPTSSWADYVSAGIGGALATTGLGRIGSIVVNAGLGGVTYLLNCDISGETYNKGDFLLSIAIGGGAGFFGGKGAKVPDLIGKHSTAQRALKTVVSNKKKTMYENIIKTCRSETIKGIRGIFYSTVTSYVGNRLREQYY